MKENIPDKNEVDSSIGRPSTEKNLLLQSLR